jgi:hypothetical protein
MSNFAWDAFQCRLIYPPKDRTVNLKAAAPTTALKAWYNLDLPDALIPIGL